MATSSDLKVLVIDDSAYNRQSITSMLSALPGVTVVGRAGDGNEGLRQVTALSPDLITLDLEMPKMDGYTFLRILMTRRPTPVIVVSSHAARESVFKALELGALDFVAKPARGVTPELRTIEAQLVEKVRAIARLTPAPLGARLRPASGSRAATMQGMSSVDASRPDTPLSPRERLGPADLRGVVCIAASTGGPPALKQVFEQLSPDLGLAVLVSQHMPASFTAAFARRLDAAGVMEVREAAMGDVLVPGVALVAPGSGSILVEAGSGGPCIRIERPIDSAAGRGVVPSGDRMMQTAAAVLGSGVLGIVLTGMGDDGALGTMAIRRAGGETIAEAESSAVIFGMPGSAIATGGVDHILTLEAMPTAIARFARSRAAKPS